MDNNTIMILLGFVATIIAIMTPIIKLNSRLDNHEIRIDRLEHTKG